MSALREIFASFTTTFDTGGLTAGDTAVGLLTGRLGGLTSVLTGGALGLAISGFAHQMTELGDEIGDTSAALSISSTELQEWRLVAGLNGVSANEMTAGLVRLQNALGEAASGNRTAGKIFRDLGVDIRDAHGNVRNASEVLSEMADPIAALGTPAERTKVLMDLFGRAGARLGPLFEQGSEGIAQARAELERLGGGATPEAIEAAGRLDDANRRLDTAFLSLKSRLSVFLLPALENLSNFGTRITATFAKLSDNSHILESAFVALGVAAAGAGSKAALAWLRAAAPLVPFIGVMALATLLVEDFWAGLEGKDSLIGRLAASFEDWTTKLWESGGALQHVAGIFETWKGMIVSIVRGLGQIAGFGDIFDGEGDGDIAIDNTDRSLRGQLTNQFVRQNREAGSILPESTQRFVAERQADEQLRRQGLESLIPRNAGSNAPQAVTITNAPVVNVNANGLSEAQAERVATRAARQAMAQANDDSADLMVQGGRE